MPDIEILVVVQGSYLARTLSQVVPLPQIETARDGGYIVRMTLPGCRERPAPSGARAPVGVHANLSAPRPYAVASEIDVGRSVVRELDVTDVGGPA